MLFGIYGLAPKSLQFSRAILGLGVLWSYIGILAVRILIQYIQHGNLELGTDRKKRAVYVGIASVVQDYLNDVRRSLQKTKSVGVITLNKNVEFKHTPFLGTLDHSRELVDLYQINEFQFCINSFPYKQMIDSMKSLNQLGQNLSYKIIDKERQFVIGSDSKNSSGMLWSYDLNPPYFSIDMQRKKRSLDIVLCLITPILLPIILLKGKLKIIANWHKVLLGTRTWIAPHNWVEPNLVLPKKGVFSPGSNLPKYPDSGRHEKNINKAYILEYEPMMDIRHFTRILFQ